MANEIVTQQALSMTSREIAELTGKRHDNVKRTIEALAEKEVIRLPQIEVSESINNLGLPQKISSFVFEGERGKRDSIVVVAQLSPEFTANLVDRWQELEAQVRTSQVQASKALVSDPVVVLRRELEFAAALSTPLHVAQVEAVKVVHVETGYDGSRWLKYAPAQSNIQPDELMLEPSDAARALGIRDGASLNQWLASAGYQVKTSAGWEPTAHGAPYCARHQWRTLFKSGYNLKWSVSFLKSLLPADWSYPALAA